jgi:hypothetical protein
MTDEELIEKLRILIDKDNGFGMSVYKVADYCLCDHTYIRRLCKRELPLAQRTRELITDGLIALAKDFNEKIENKLDI